MQVNLEKKDRCQGQGFQFYFLVVPIHSVECMAVNLYEGIAAVFGGTRVKSRSHFILEEKTTLLNSDVCQVQAHRC